MALEDDESGKLKDDNIIVTDTVWVMIHTILQRMWHNSTVLVI